MKVRNIAQIGGLACLIATTQANCMFMKILRKTGTAIGIGLPTVPFVKAAVDAAQQVSQDPAAGYPGSQPLSADQEAFYRKTVGDRKVELRYAPEENQIEGHAGNTGNLIVMPEKVYTRNGKVSVEDALATNNIEALNIAEGIIEHEYGHYLHKDTHKKCAEIAAVPIATTALAAVLFKRTFPVSNTLPKQAGRAVTKILAGQGLFEVNKEAVNLYSAHESRKREFAADQNISIKNRAPVMDSLEVMNDLAFTSIAKQQYPDMNAMELKTMAKKIEIDHNNSPYATHPPLNARKKALGVHTSSQQSMIGQRSNSNTL